MPLLTLPEAKAHLKIPDEDTSADAVLQTYADAILGPIEDYLRRVLVQRTVVQDLDLRGGEREFWLSSVPVISLTSLVSLDGTTTYDPAGLDVRSNGHVRVISGASPSGTVVATYEAGYQTIPANYKQGALTTLQYLWEARRNAGQTGGYDSATVSPEEYHDIRTAASDFIRRSRVWLASPRVLVS